MLLLIWILITRYSQAFASTELGLYITLCLFDFAQIDHLISAVFWHMDYCKSANNARNVVRLTSVFCVDVIKQS